MSSQLPIQDLSTAVVGQTFKIDFTPFVKFNPANISQNAHLAIYNESGCGLLCQMQQSGTQFFIPAGGWGISNIAPNDATCLLTVKYLITNAPVSSLIATYYAPNEEVPQSYTLGNSPVGGAVSTSGGGGIADHLINTGNAPSSSAIIDIQESGSPAANVFADNQGNFTLAQNVSAVYTQLFNVVAGASANSTNVSISDSNHVTQVNGLLQGLNGAYFGGIASGQPSVVQGYSASNQPVFETFLQHNSTIGYMSVPVNDSLTNMIGFYSNGNSVTPQMIGFQANGHHLVAFDAEVNPNETVLKWPYGDIKAGNTDQIIESTNATSLRLNAPTGNNINLDINNSIILQIASTILNSNVLLAINSGVFSTGNGSVSGTADLYCPIWGSSLKVGWINLRNNFQTATPVTLVFPSPQMNFAFYYSGDISGTQWQANLGASAAAMRHTFSIGASGLGQGSSESASVIKNLWLGQFLGSDRILINTTAGGNINSFIWFIGQ